MAESIAKGMHHVAHQSTKGETDEDLFHFHDAHLDLQERMRNPIAFHAEMIDDIIFIFYIDDSIFLGDDDSKLQDAVRNIQDVGLNIEDQGHPADYVGVKIKKTKDDSYEFTQCALINSIIEDVGLKDAKVKPVPAKVSQRLHAFEDEPPFNIEFNYRSAVGKLNYLAQTTRPDIMYATHQVAKYSSDPRQSHGEAILYSI
jgi:hypothetical protein